MKLYNLEIVGNKIYLDGVEVKGVNSYHLEQTEDEIPELTLKMYVEPTVVVKRK